MNRKLNWKLILSAVGFLLIGASMIFPRETWLIITGALLFVIGMVRKPKKRK
ncbi:hypothetical protein [Desulforamulus putei]|uniref:Uncharacterized protein n=1 Tax=Desulforamulus putei DSM 12395 TaxID=1121429 RepID=A0A1M4TDJ7_9FIRM|nr:hypothetical protein [Desulforamulus putei]SHE42357.1 hypothetical protein SAMN02745133_00427 [Desulforamulus putei DSM 12395]